MNGNVTVTNEPTSITHGDLQRTTTCWYRAIQHYAFLTSQLYTILRFFANWTYIYWLIISFSYKLWLLRNYASSKVYFSWFHWTSMECSTRARARSSLLRKAKSCVSSEGVVWFVLWGCCWHDGYGMGFTCMFTMVYLMVMAWLFTMVMAWGWLMMVYVYLIVGIVKHNCSSTLCRTPCYAVGDDANGKNFESECANSQGLRGSW